MATYRLAPHYTQLHPDAFVARGAVVVGDVHLGAEASVWFGAVVRGDTEAIRIGARSNVQDGSVVHVDDGFPVTVHEGVTIGHNCIVHGCEIHDGALIGMGSVVMNGVVVGAQCLVGAGALLTSGKVFPPRMLILGSPARAVRPLTDVELADIAASAAHYVEAGRAFRVAGLHQDGGPPAGG